MLGVREARGVTVLMHGCHAFILRKATLNLPPSFTSLWTRSNAINTDMRSMGRWMMFGCLNLGIKGHPKCRRRIWHSAK